jgi:hypothetical protein
MARRKSAAPWALIAGGAASEVALRQHLAAQSKAERKRQGAKSHPLQPLQGSRYDPGQAPQVGPGTFITTRSSKPSRRSY